MTTHRRYQLACAASAFTVGAIGTGCVRAHQWWPAAMFALTALVLIEASLRERRAHRRVLAEHAHARRAALGEQPPPLDPCCPLWRASGTVHAPNCTRIRFEQVIAGLVPCDLDDGDSPFGWRDNTKDSA